MSGYSDTWNTVYLTREIVVRGQTFGVGTPMRFSWLRPDGAYVIVDGSTEWIPTGAYRLPPTNTGHLSELRTASPHMVTR